MILGLVILSSSLLIDSIPRETREVSFFRSNLLLILAASIALAFLSLTFNLFVFQAYFVLAIILLFAFFRSVTYAMSGNLHYPAFMRSKVMVLGDGPSAQIIRGIIENSRGRFDLSGVVPMKELGADPGKNNDRLYLLAQKAGVQTLVVSFPERRGIMPVQQILRCRMLGMAVVEAQSFYERVTRKLYVENLKPSNIIFSSGFRLSPVRRYVKRFADVTGALFGLALVLPLFPFIALIIRLDSPGPVWFRQTRTGLGGAPFRIIKFRTMRVDAEKESGAVWAQKHDPRITRIGSFLRKTRVDELPQLINVLMGDMSLVGPRPERPEFISELEKSIPFYSERHYVKPGVTGWAQVRYPYGSSIEDALEKLRYDLYYIKNQSFRLEFEIVLRTILVIFSGSGAR